MTVSDAETAVRARRRLTNRLIAARDAARLKPFFDPNIKLIVGDGGLIIGADEVVHAFAQQFSTPMLAQYERSTDSVEVHAAATRAAEIGRWRGEWSEDGRRVGQTGRFLAVWKAVRGQWLLESEVYVSLTAVEPLAG